MLAGGHRLGKAMLIWASTTSITVKDQPTELDPENNPVIVEHNRLAAKVMKEEGVVVNDLYSLMLPNLKMARGDNFHWQAEPRASGQDSE